MLVWCTTMVIHYPGRGSSPASPLIGREVLTKRAERLREYLSDRSACFRVARLMDAGARKRMKPDVGDQGHLRVQLHRTGKLGKRGERFLVHRLVLEAFVGPSDLEGAQGCHHDGNPLNNVAANLSWGDQGDNWEDRKRHGNYRSYSKLTELQAEEIRRRSSAGESVACFVKQLGSQPHYHTCRNPECTHPDCGYTPLRLHDKKGGDISEWSIDLRIREFPQCHANRPS